MPLRLPWSRRPAPLSDEEIAEFLAPPSPKDARPGPRRPRPRGGVPRLNGPAAIVLYLVGGICVGLGVIGMASATTGVPSDDPFGALARLVRNVVELVTGQ